jgi:hypothetical protein
MSFYFETVIYLKCDWCGKEVNDGGRARTELRETVRSVGWWLSRDGLKRCLCPDCHKESNAKPEQQEDSHE